MGKGKRIIAFLRVAGLTLAVSLLITGCWNRRELTSMGIVSAMGLDEGENHEINLTVQIINAGAMKGAEGVAGQGKTVWILSSSGKSVFDAIRNLVEKSGRRLYYPHNSVIVFGSQLARSGISPIIDLFARDQEMRLLTWVVVAQGKAADVINADSELDSIPAKQLEKLLKNSPIVSKAVAVDMLELDGDLLSKITQPVLGRVLLYDNNGKEQVQLDGAGVFNQDRLIGWLDSSETKGYLFTRGKVKSGSVIVPCQENPDRPTTLEIIRTHSKIKPELADGEVRFVVEVDVKANVVEQACSETLITPETISTLESKLNKVIENQIRTTIDVAQTKYKVDIFGFGKEVMRKYPDEWKNISANWEDEFPHVKTDIRVNSKIGYTDLMK